MAVFHSETCIRTLNEERVREAAVQSAAVFVFRKMAEAGEIGGADIVGHAPIFDFWSGEGEYLAGNLRRCPENGKIYRALEVSMEPMSANSDSGGGKILPPSKTPELWEAVG